MSKTSFDCSEIDSKNAMNLKHIHCVYNFWLAFLSSAPSRFASSCVVLLQTISGSVSRHLLSACQGLLCTAVPFFFPSRDLSAFSCGLWPASVFSCVWEKALFKWRKKTPLWLTWGNKVQKAVYEDRASIRAEKFVLNSEAMNVFECFKCHCCNQPTQLKYIVFS